MSSKKSAAKILKPSAEAHLITHPPDYIARFSSGQHSRKIFHSGTSQISYNDFEQQSLQEFKRYLRKEGFDYFYSDATLLRFLYSAAFKLNEATSRLATYQQWISSPSLQMLTPKVDKILSSGVAYTLGTDRMYRPVIYFNLAKADFKNNSMEEYYCAVNQLLKQVMEGLFVPGRVENWVVVIDTQGNILLPVHMLESFVRKLAVVYCGCLEKLYIINARTLHKLGFNMFSELLAKSTQDKIEMLHSDEMHKLQEAIPVENLQRKYGGLLPNLTVYWPIEHQLEAVSAASSRTIQLESTALQSHDVSLYQSFVKDQRFSVEPPTTQETVLVVKQTRCGCFDGNSNCSIF